MPYTPTVWTDHVTMGTQARMNNLETQYSEATQSLPKDLYAPFVVTGIATSRDGTNLKQLNVTSGTAFLKQSDGTLRRRDTAASTTGQFLTATPSTTYYLFLKNDGTWQWGTSASGPTNSLAITQATTDASGNISVVTDQRALQAVLFSTLAGTVYISPNVASRPAIWGTLVTNPGGDTHIIAAGVSGETTPRVSMYTRSSDHYGGILGGPGSGITAHMYAQASGWFIPEALATDNGAFATDGSGNISAVGNITGSASPTISSRQSAGAAGITFKSWNGTASVTPFSIGGQFSSALAWVDNSGNFNGPAGGGIPTTRNGTATSVPVYTGTSSPSSPPTGSVWIKA